MSTHYKCDVCGMETLNPEDLEEVTKGDLICDLCKKCLDKMFKPVKAYHSTMRIKLEWGEK